ncbi:hypothetical protein ACI48D_25555 [Massilia sp. LXY-6]|uniref:hypothetical protein n=1 Tax=Massilia sp. LXY-6 TaxID=3379823 RepID=UPI003EE093E0
MKQLLALASTIGRHAVLCCGAVVLLSACGAGVTDPANGQQSQTAAELASGTNQSAAYNAAAIPTGAEAGTQDAAAEGAAAAPAASPAGNIEPAYDSNPQSPRNAGLSNQTEAPADAARGDAPADGTPAACDTGSCQH